MFGFRQIALFTLFGLMLAGCLAHFPAANETITVPQAAKKRDVLEISIDAAKAVGLPPVTKFDKANGIVQFGSFDTPVLGYTAQVRKRSDGSLDVTVKRGSTYVERDVNVKAQEFFTAIKARLSA